MDHSRRVILKQGAAAAGLLLSGCSHIPMLSNIRSLSDPRLPTADRYPITAQQLQDLPYAALGVQLEGATRAVMILATVDNGVTTWVSADYEQIRLNGPTLVGTQGLNRDLADTRWLMPDPILSLPAGGRLASVHSRNIDVGRGNHSERDVRVISSYRDEGRETLNIFGTPRLTRRISEVADIPQWRWQRQNYYWVDAGNSAQLWRSLTGFAPDVPQLTLETLKKYRSA